MKWGIHKFTLKFNLRFSARVIRVINFKRVEWLWPFLDYNLIRKSALFEDIENI